MMIENLGRYVCVRPAKNGIDRVLMVVPKHLRPPGWPKSIRLPEVGAKLGSLNDPLFRRRVIADAQRLNIALERRREKEALRCAPDHTLPKLAEIYMKRAGYKKLSMSRRYRNCRSIGKILEWSAARGHPDVRSLTQMDVDDFLSIYDDRPATRFDMRSVWNELFAAAVYAGWLPVNPLPKGNWQTPKPKVVAVWRHEDVARYSAMARQMGQPALAVMIQVMMAIGQRPGDMRAAKWDESFFGDRFVLEQSKMKRLVNIPIPQDLRQLIESVRVEGSAYVFNDADTGTGFTADKLRMRFGELRHALAQRGEPVLHLRALRHSCVCQLMEAGLPTSEIAAITGHLLARVNTILERYFPDRYGAADRGMRRAFAAQGRSPDEFGDVSEMPALDWAGDRERMSRYAGLACTEQNFFRAHNIVRGRHRLGRSAT